MTAPGNITGHGSLAASVQTGFLSPQFGVYKNAPDLVRKYLLTVMPAWYVISTLVMNPRPAQGIVVRSATVGGNNHPVLSNRRLIIWVYDLSEDEALDTGELVRGHLYSAMYVRGSGIRNTVVVGEPYYFPDPDDPAKTPRAQLTVDVLLRAVPWPVMS
jgi:hypothetical protein